MLKNITEESCLTVNALVSSRIDYCNSLFASLTLSELKRLQGVQNSLCRVVTRSSRYTHTTPNLEKLHWLPVKYRVLFKIGLITYKVLKYGQPVYLKDKLHPYTSSRNTRRSSPKYKFLQVPSFVSKIHKSHKYLTKSFSHHAPAFWNSLPVHVRTSPSVTSFRKHLKTHLFKSAFPT